MHKKTTDFHTQIKSLYTHLTVDNPMTNLLLGTPYLRHFCMFLYMKSVTHYILYFYFTILIKIWKNMYLIKIFKNGTLSS